MLIECSYRSSQLGRLWNLEWSPCFEAHTYALFWGTCVLMVPTLIFALNRIPLEIHVSNLLVSLA